MKHVAVLALGLALLLLPAVMVTGWVVQAKRRLETSEAPENAAPAVAVASRANEAYCTPELKQILRRVLASCGLIGGGTGGRGCQPIEAKHVATMAGGDFNALFTPMKERGGIVQFDLSSSELDAADGELIDSIFAERAGASYFFVVSRASQDGATSMNRELSKRRAQAVMTHLDQTFQDSELEKQVGLLWLGEEYAQLDPSFCQWPRSGGEGSCRTEELNRSAFLAWIDCTL